MHSTHRQPVPEARALSSHRHARQRAAVAVVLCLAVGDACAASPAIVLGQTLALLGAGGGLIAGVMAGVRPVGTVKFWIAFLIYLGLVCVLSSTWSGTLDIVPLTLVLGAAAGVAPFAACYHLARLVARRLSAKPGTPPDTDK